MTLFARSYDNEGGAWWNLVFTVPCQCCAHRLAVPPHWRCCTDKTLFTSSQFCKRSTSTAYPVSTRNICDSIIQRQWYSGHERITRPCPPLLLEKEAADADAKDLRFGIMNLRLCISSRPVVISFLTGLAAVIFWNIFFLSPRESCSLHPAQKLVWIFLNRWTEL